MKILLATDGSDYSKAAVKAVAERQWPEGGKVKIISAVEIPYTPTTEVWVLPDSITTTWRMRRGHRRKRQSKMRSKRSGQVRAPGLRSPVISREAPPDM
jgi:hypothetical protein